MPNAIIYTFTGTGNSLWLANRSAEELKSRDFSVSISRLDAGNIKVVNGHNEAEVIGIVSPVYGFGLPQIVAKFLKNLPEGRGQKTFVFIATGNTEVLEIKGWPLPFPPTEGVCIWQCGFNLEKKGYEFLVADAFEMSTNWVMFFNPPNEAYRTELELKNSSRIKDLVGALLSEAKDIKKIHILPAAFFGTIYFCFVLFARRWLGKCFTVSRECNACGICAKTCPGKTILMRNEKPYWKFNCQQCFRCINTCPKKAIQCSSVNFWGMVLLQFLGGSIPVWIGLKVPGGAVELTKMAFALGVTFPYVWFVHFLEFKNIMPAWYLTKKKQRYKHRDLTIK